MLSLTRRPGERLIFQLPDGRTMSLEIAGFKGFQVRLWIEVPADVLKDREEIACRRNVDDPQIEGG